MSQFLSTPAVPATPGGFLSAPIVMPRETSSGPFAEILARASAPSQSPDDRARAAAADFIALTFIQPIFKQLRQTIRPAPPFAPSEGEKQFGALLDAELARSIARKAGFPLTERVARDLLGIRRDDARALPTPSGR